MKTKQTKIDRSAAKWLPGAMALAATTASSQAFVQITLLNNKISTGGNQLVADLTGDGTDDLTFSSTTHGPTSAGFSALGGWVRAGTWRSDSFLADASFGDPLVLGVGVGDATGAGPSSVAYLNPIMFTDSRINEGTPTGAWLEVHAFNTSANDHTVELTRLIFDDTSATRPAFTEIPGTQTEWAAVSAVPEPTTNLGLLALGAGGLLMRRRAKRIA